MKKEYLEEGNYPDIDCQLYRMKQKSKRSVNLNRSFR